MYRYQLYKNCEFCIITTFREKKVQLFVVKLGLFWNCKLLTPKLAQQSLGCFLQLYLYGGFFLAPVAFW